MTYSYDNKMIYKKKPVLSTALESLHLDKPDTERVSVAYQHLLSSYMDNFQKTTSLLREENKEKVLKNFAAHAGYLRDKDGKEYKDRFVNFKDKKQNLAPGKLFPGVKLMPQKTIEVNRPIGPWRNKLAYDIEDIFRNNMANEYRVKNTPAFIKGLQNMYEKNGQTLHPMTQRLVEEHIAHNGDILPTMAGIAGLHAEVQALNQIFIATDQNEPLNPARYDKAMLQSSIFTKRLTTANAGKDFPACHNCSGIIKSPANVITGMVDSAGSNFSKQIAKRYRSQSLSN
ncbi:YwqJ-related putative deaminase [Xenorhabdus cabanillasii]|uniref:Uncharacterized protein n=1 Tax=Xenorhabdus cabanillasii JM26 TaxID=1427517 RepID=W1J9F9_9GAMM|nr:YwqJ-related putative deaminase [Xenorhabdus cabanillasii]PHM78854.1 hypothetical protein Xcab_00431 [Xenorhabdus cabanillasii JM26]CDL86130.1 hypothetical protein XCR1_2750019 [Xenorhabdus cabanillasii JM26]